MVFRLSRVARTFQMTLRRNISASQKNVRNPTGAKRDPFAAQTGVASQERASGHGVPQGINRLGDADGPIPSRGTPTRQQGEARTVSGEVDRENKPRTGEAEKPTAVGPRTDQEWEVDGGRAKWETTQANAPAGVHVDPAPRHTQRDPANPNEGAGGVIH
jgi:hypothetical protein